MLSSLLIPKEGFEVALQNETALMLEPSLYFSRTATSTRTRRLPCVKN